MPSPKSIKIAGTELKGVQDFSIEIKTPTKPRGYYDGNPGCATVTIVRRAVDSPITEMFKFATNEDGSQEIIDGSIILQTAKRQETYKIELKKAHICGWTLFQPKEGSNLEEVITLKVGEMSLSAGGKVVSYKFTDYIERQ